MKSVDLDIGGTFTDCFVTWDEKTVIKKTPTTSYDLSVGLINVLKEVVHDIDISLRDLVSQADVFRYSTTVAMNKLIERQGPNLSLIVTEGFEDITMIGKGGQWSDGMNTKYNRNLAKVKKPKPLIPREMIVGVKERIDSTGKILRPLDEDDVLEKVQYLVDRGSRGFVVCLMWSFINPEHEQRIKKLINEEYPDFYLGSMPVMLSSEVHPKRFEYTRANTTILNAYLHQLLAEEISSIRDGLRSYDYRKPLLMVHNTGGMAESFRTAAVQTYNGGPVAGLIGGAYLARQYDIKSTIVADMGGTSFDLGIITDGGSTKSYLTRPVIDRWLVDLPILESRSIGAGGGSIARLNPLLADRLEVGPESAGAMPGPVAYDQGSKEPTVTDADIVLGYINPRFFHGGQKRLNKEKAYRSIETKIANPLGISVEEGASLIKRVVDANMGNEIYKQTVLKGLDPRNFVIFAIGGAGPTHCTGFASYAGVRKIITFPYSSVFCAFSSSTLDIMHIYEQSRHLILLQPQTRNYLQDYESFNKVVEGLEAKAIRDLEGEGFEPSEVIFSLELDMKYGGQLNVLRSSSPCLRLNSAKDVARIYAQFEKEYAEAYSSLGVYPEGGVNIENFILKASITRPKYQLPVYEQVQTPVETAYKETRQAYWPELGELAATRVYDLNQLGYGHELHGPALVETPDTTYVIAPGWRFGVDRHRNGIWERVEA